MRRHIILAILLIGIYLTGWFGCGNDDEDKNTLMGKDGALKVLIPVGEFEMGII